MKKAIDSPLVSAVTHFGGRLTKQRKEIYALFERIHEPMTIQSLRKHSRANEVSVYRTIRLFRQEGLIEEIIYPDGSKRYALGGHHHHIICSQCGYTEHVPCSTPSSVPKIRHSKFASIDHHEVTYQGTCTRCV